MVVTSCSRRLVKVITVDVLGLRRSMFADCQDVRTALPADPCGMGGADSMGMPPFFFSFQESLRLGSVRPLR